jgi:hypothetical protein
LRQVYRFKEPSSNLFKKTAWQRIGGYTALRRVTFDLYFNISLLASGPSILIPERLVAVRRHAASDGAKIPATLALAELVSLTQEIIERMGVSADESDKKAALGWQQYRLLELIGQRFRYRKSEVKELVSSYGQVLLESDGWGTLCRLASRRLLCGDLQGYS